MNGFKARLNRSESLYVPLKISESLIKKTIQKQRKGKIDHSSYLKERGTLRHMIQAGRIQEATLYL